MKIISLFLPLILGSIVGLIVSSNGYTTLNQPPLAPPGVLFPVVWSILYLLMGISYNLTSKSKDIKLIYYLQLIFNYLWSFIFFVFEMQLLAIIWIIILIFLVIIMTIKFYNDNKLAAYLQIPYLIWLIFALYLSIGIYILN